VFHGDDFSRIAKDIVFPPNIDRRLEAQLPCKGRHIQRVPVRSWLQEEQRFDVTVELAEPDPDSQEARGITVRLGNTLD